MSDPREMELLETLPLIVYRVLATHPYKPLYVSRGIEMLGYTREEWMAEPDSWLQHMHHGDRERVLVVPMRP